MLILCMVDVVWILLVTLTVRRSRLCCVQRLLPRNFSFGYQAVLRDCMHTVQAMAIWMAGL